MFAEVSSSIDANNTLCKLLSRAAPLEVRGTLRWNLMRGLTMDLCPLSSIKLRVDLEIMNAQR